MHFRMWKREDGEEPKALALDAKKGPGPGRLYDVTARSAKAAREVLALHLSAEPDRKAERERWLAWDEARELVREVIA
jgi:hypothetical protein